MPLTPEDVSNKRFTPVRLREGYDMNEVDQFLDEVEAELARLIKENADLRTELAQAKSAPKAAAPVVTPEPVKVVEAKPVPVEVKPVVVPAAEIRANSVGDASSAAARLLEIATKNADELVSDAKDEADKIVSEAKLKADRLNSESKESADRLESDARKRAQMLDTETKEKREQLFGELEAEKARLNAEIEKLRAFEREYRSRLKSYFNEQLDLLEKSGAATTSFALESGGSKRARNVDPE